MAYSDINASNADIPCESLLYRHRGRTDVPSEFLAPSPEKQYRGSGVVQIEEPQTATRRAVARRAVNRRYTSEETGARCTSTTGDRWASFGPASA